jgi:hypothetical protein
MVRAIDLLRRCQWEDADDVLGQRVLISSVALGSDVRAVVGASHLLLLGNGVSTYMGHEGLSQDVSYDVYVKLGADHMGRPEASAAEPNLPYPQMEGSELPDGRRDPWYRRWFGE